MNESLVKAMPPGNFVEVSALARDWQDTLRTLVSQRQNIKYDFYPLPGIPEELRSLLKQHGYQDFVLESDQWQHFLVPGSNAN